MKKIEKIRIILIAKKRRRKHLKRIRKDKKYFDGMSAERKTTSFKKRHDAKQLQRFNFKLNEFFEARGNRPIKELSKEFKIPEVFSLETNYSETILTLSLIRKSLLKFIGGTFKIDFTYCKSTDFSGLLLLKVMLDEYIEALKKLDERLLFYGAIPTIRIQHSQNADVNLKLLAGALIPKTQAKQEEITHFVPISMMKNIITGRKTQKHYSENRKGLAATNIRKYINESLKRHKFELNPKGANSLDGMISEILNNAEDHSIFDKWYAFANLFETPNTTIDTEVVGELNLAFLNFGFSIYEGFEETKAQNHKIYNEMEELYKLVINKRGGERFTKENLFTLYALQDGNSRLKFEEASRGTGTMKFINSFLNLGDYENEERKIMPRLLIFSGSTMLKCDNLFKPFDLDGAFYLSLNSENDMASPPTKSHLVHLEQRFPGTLITGKIYLNHTHMKTKIENYGNQKN